VISGLNRGEPRQSVRALPRALAATDADHNKRIEGEAVAIVHAPSCSLSVLKSSSASRLPTPAYRRVCTGCAANTGYSPRTCRNAQIDPKRTITTKSIGHLAPARAFVDNLKDQAIQPNLNFSGRDVALDFNPARCHERDHVFFWNSPMESIEGNEIRTEAVDFSFGELLNLHKDKEIIIRPEYQRLFRWSNEQRSRLIESILLKLPIPPIFLIEDDNGVLELIDGLQRTSSVLQFLDHDAIKEPELVLSGCDILKDINGKKYDDFSTSIRLGMKRTPIRAVIIKKTGSDFVKYEMFKRLNTGGSLLSSQEIRNCSSRMISGGAEFYNELQSLAKFPSFLTATSRVPPQDLEQKADEELVLRFFAVEVYRPKICRKCPGVDRFFYGRYFIPNIWNKFG
jgi:Protein of unknown function DUF262